MLPCLSLYLSDTHPAPADKSRSPPIMSGANSIKVVARFRPQNKIELASGGQPIVSFTGNDTCVLNVSRLDGPSSCSAPMRPAVSGEHQY